MATSGATSTSSPWAWPPATWPNWPWSITRCTTRQGGFALAGGRVCAEGDPPLTFSGIGVYCPELFADCSPGAFPLAPLLRSAMARGLVGGIHHQGTWIDIGTPQRLADLDRMLSQSQPG